MEKGYTYVNKNGKNVGGRAADNHWLTEHGYSRLADLIDDVAIRVAHEIKEELDVYTTNRSEIIMTTKSA